MTGYLDAGLLDQRATLYRYTSSTSVSGVPVERYPEETERWCRLEPPSGREVTMGLKEATRVDAVLVFRDDVPVGSRWLAKVGATLYRILAPLPRRGQGMTEYLVAFADDAEPVTVAS